MWSTKFFIVLKVKILNIFSLGSTIQYSLTPACSYKPNFSILSFRAVDGEVISMIMSGLPLQPRSSSLFSSQIILRSGSYMLSIFFIFPVRIEYNMKRSRIDITFFLLHNRHWTISMFHHFMANTAEHHFLKNIQATTANNKLINVLFIDMFDNFLAWISF